MTKHSRDTSPSKFNSFLHGTRRLFQAIITLEPSIYPPAWEYYPILLPSPLNFTDVSLATQSVALSSYFFFIFPLSLTITDQDNLSWLSEDRTAFIKWRQEETPAYLIKPLWCHLVLTCSVLTGNGCMQQLVPRIISLPRVHFLYKQEFRSDHQINYQKL